MKRKTKIKYLKAASLLLILMTLVGTIITGITIAKKITTENLNVKIVEEKPEKLIKKKLIVFGKGEINYFNVKDQSRFIGDKWDGWNGYYYSCGLDGYIWNTNIEMQLTWSMTGGPYSLFIFDTLNIKMYRLTMLPEDIEILNFTGRIYWNGYSVPHGPAGSQYNIFGIAEGYQGIYLD